MKRIVYAVETTPCVYDSGYEVKSLWMTKESAEKELEKLKKKTASAHYKGSLPEWVKFRVQPHTINE